MIFLQISNLDSLRKVIVDSMIAVQKQQLSSIDYVAKVDSFYNSAWMKLVALFGFIGIVIPLLTTYLQNKRNEKDQKIMKEEILAELTTEIDKYLEIKISQIQHASEGVTYHLQADLLYKNSEFKNAFGEFVNAATCYFIGNDYNNFKNAFDDIIKCFSKVTKNDLIDIKSTDSEYYNVEELINKLVESKDSQYKPHIEKLKFELGKLITPSQ